MWWFVSRIWVIALLAAGVADAAWERQIVTGKGVSTGTSAPHALAWYTQKPWLRKDAGEFCDDCEQPESGKFSTKLEKIGTLRGLTIYDLFCFFNNDETPDWKSILVEVAPDRYREIYHLEPPAAILKPAFIFKAGGEYLLGTNDEIPGTGNYYYEDYWWFGPDGPVRVNIEAIGEALKSALPPGHGVWKGGGLDIENLRYRSPVWKDGDANCCPTGGSVELTLALDKGKLTVTKVRYDPKAVE